MDAEGPEGDAELLIERVVLNETEEGRRIAATFVRVFGDFVSNEVRPILRDFAGEGGQPQLLMNGLAELLRATATSIEFPLDHPRAGAPAPSGPADPGRADEGG
jgi:hypothetical protein